MRHALAVALVLGGAAACSFPSLTSSDAGAASDSGYVEDRGSSSSSSGLDEASGASSSGSNSDAAEDSPSEAPTGDGGPCDQDGDGYRSNSSGCGGNDCCDTDSNVHPGQTGWFTQQSNCKTFDYNCDGKDEPAYSSNLTCVLVWSVGCIPGCGGGGSCLCKAQSCTTGYPGPDPGCGNAFQYDDCKPANAFSCTPTLLVPSQVQACR